MTIAGGNSIVIKDVLVGEVWLGSGQSNMEFVLVNANNHDEEIARAEYPMIHIFHVKRTESDQPLEDVVGTWEVCSPKSIPRFSAVEYFFGRHLHQALHVPMGLIEIRLGRHSGTVLDQPAGSGGRSRTQVHPRRLGRAR